MKSFRISLKTFGVLFSCCPKDVSMVDTTLWKAISTQVLLIIRVLRNVEKFLTNKGDKIDLKRE
jgi:hypothetical protein